MNTDELERKHKAFMRYDGNDVVSLLIHAGELQTELLAEVKRLQTEVRGLLFAYDSIVDVVREFIELEEYCSRDAANWLRDFIDLGGEDE